MKKALVVALLIVTGFGGFLYYDWHTKTRQLAAEPSIPQYSWTDSKGVRHFTDSPPPAGAQELSTHVQTTPPEGAVRTRRRQAGS